MPGRTHVLPFACVGHSDSFVFCVAFGDFGGPFQHEQCEKGPRFGRQALASKLKFLNAIYYILQASEC